MPKQKASLIVLVFAFIVGVLWIAAKDDEDSVGPSQQTEGRSSVQALSQSAQEGERRVLAVLPANVQGLWLNSVRALGPRAEAYLALQNSKSPAQLEGEVRNLMFILQELPSQAQRIMDEVVGVNQTAEGIGSSASEGGLTPEDFWKSRRDMRNKNYETWRERPNQ